MVWWHTPNEGKRTPAEAGRLQAMGVKAGIPDLMLIYAGKVYGLEIKTRKGRTSAGQDAMLAALRAAGGYAAVTYGLDAALAQIAAWGLFGRGN